jgi:hypothetical protein
MVWVLGRVYVRDQADLPAAQAYQKQLDIRPLSRLNDASYVSANPHPEGPNAEGPTMMDTLQKIGPQVFFERFMKLTAANPPAPQDAQFIRNVLEPLGLSVGKPKAWKSFDYLDRRALAMGLQSVLDELKNRASLEQQRPLTLTGWSSMDGNLSQGSYGTNYLARAAVAALGLGANLRSDAMYFNASIDGDEKRLDGSMKYHLTFAAGNIPPARGFWSITLYDDKGYLVANPLARYEIDSGSNLVYERDGSLEIYFQPDDPGAKHRANWLPTPHGQTFELCLRAYWPKEELLEGRWTPPPVMAETTSLYFQSPSAQLRGLVAPGLRD